MTDLFFFLGASAGGGLVCWWPAGRRSGWSALYRFLAFEALLGLTLLTRSHWFAGALSTPQVISWLCLAAGLTLAVLALSRRPARPAMGNPTSQDPEETPTLPPRRGVYKIVRHPIYAAALFTGWGLFAKSLAPFDNASLLCAFLLTGVSLFLVWAARTDDRADYLKFGTAYLLYVRSSKMLIPFIL